MKTIVVEKVQHEGADRVALRFPYDKLLISMIKELQGAKWSSTMKYWHIPDGNEIIKVLLEKFHGIAYLDYSAMKINLAEKIRLKKESTQQEKSKGAGFALKDHVPLSEKTISDIAKFKRWMEASRYPQSTVDIYTSMITTFFRFVSPREPGECNGDDLIRIAEEYIIPKGLSNSFQNQMISAVKKFYGNIYKSAIDVRLVNRPRVEHRLPGVLSKDEVKRMLGGIANEKHRMMLSLIYACGLRRSELLGLFPSDIEKGRKLLRIRQSKGNRDRVVPISDRTIEMVERYIDHYRPVRYLFEGQRAGEPYSTASLEKVLKNACEKAGLRKEVSLHWLRHSYATHLLESGTDLRYIQELLGHKSSKTTQIYTHVTTKSIQNIRSPFDDL
jgi:integrase/recombinase XerD